MNLKRFAILSLSLCLLGGSLSINQMKKINKVYADDPAYVCEISETGEKYETVSAACAAMTSGQTINMLADSVESSSTGLKANGVLNLNEFFITYASTAYFNVGEVGLVINATSGGIHGLADASIFKFQVNYSNEYLTINGGTYDYFGLSYAKDGITKTLSSDIVNGFIGHLVINDGTFLLNVEARRNRIEVLANSSSFTKEETLSEGDCRYAFQVKSKNIVESQTTDASLILNYDCAPGYWRPAKVDDLTVGRNVLFAVVNHSDYFFNQIKNVKGKVCIINLTKYSTYNYTSSNYYLGTGEETNSHHFYTEEIDGEAVFRGPVLTSQIATVSSFTKGVGETGSSFSFTNYAGNIVCGQKGTNYLIVDKTKTRVDSDNLSLDDRSKYQYYFSFNQGQVDFNDSPKVRYLSIDSKMMVIKDTHRGYFEPLGTNTDTSQNTAVVAYVFEPDEYDVKEASLRAGKCLDKETYDFITNSKEYDSDAGIRVIYATNTSLDGDELDINNAEGDIKMAPARVNTPNASEVDAEGNYYQFGLVITDIPSNHFTDLLTVRIVYSRNDSVCYTQERELSIALLAKDYLDNRSTDEAVITHQGVLEYLSSLIA